MTQPEAVFAVLLASIHQAADFNRDDMTPPGGGLGLAGPYLQSFPHREMSGERRIMQTIPLEEAQSHLAEIIDKLIPGEEIVLIQNGRARAKLVKTARTSWPCKAGSAKDLSRGRETPRDRNEQTPRNPVQ